MEQTPPGPAGTRKDVGLLCRPKFVLRLQLNFYCRTKRRKI